MGRVWPHISCPDLFSHSLARNTTIDGYGRRLAIATALILILVVGGLLIAAFQSTMSSLYTSSSGYTSGTWYVVWTMGVILISGFWAILTGAYAARLYPYHEAQRDKVLREPPRAYDLVEHGFTARLITLMSEGFSLTWVIVLGIVGGAALDLHSQGADALQDLERLTRYVVLAIATLGISPFYTGFGNLILLECLKVLVFEDYLPHLSAQSVRVWLTIISFFASCVFVWWIVYFVPLGVPLIALYAAYNVYHSLALPPEGYEKSKRKEKASW